MFFVDSWTLGVNAASENYLHRHQPPKHNEPPLPASFSSFTVLPFFNFDPPAPAAPPAASPQVSTTEATADSSAKHGWPELGNDGLANGPLTLQTACRLLGVAATSTREQIKAAYRKMASRYHPDLFEHTGLNDAQYVSDRMSAINEAYRLLTSARFDPSV